MKTALSYVIAALLVSGLAWVVWSLGSFWVRMTWPPAIPEALAFRRELDTTRSLRDVAEGLVPLFAPHRRDGVVCLGVVRGNAGRVLFHGGPPNRGRRVNLYRPDYVLHVVRVSKTRVALELRLNRPYSYFRIRRAELEPLVDTLRTAYGGLSGV